MCKQEKENRLNDITPEEVEKMWAQFMDETEHHCLACQHSEDPYNPFCGLVDDQPGTNDDKCPWLRDEKAILPSHVTLEEELAPSFDFDQAVETAKKKYKK